MFDMHHKSPGDHLYIYTVAMVNGYQHRKGGPHTFFLGGGRTLEKHIAGAHLNPHAGGEAGGAL